MGTSLTPSISGADSLATPRSRIPRWLADPSVYLVVIRSAQILASGAWPPSVAVALRHGRRLPHSRAAAVNQDSQRGEVHATYTLLSVCRYLRGCGLIPWTSHHGHIVCKRPSHGAPRLAQPCPPDIGALTPQQKDHTTQPGDEKPHDGQAGKRRVFIVAWGCIST